MIFNINNKLHDQWVAYALHDKEGVLQYLGCIRYGELLSLSDARRNPMFPEIFGEQETIQATVLHIGKNRHEAQNYVWFQIRQNGRPPMLYARSTQGRKMQVKCIETGETWDSIKEAAKAHDLHASNLCNYLNGRGKHSGSLKGYTYRKVFAL